MASPTMRRQMCSATALWFVRSSQGWTLTQMDEGKDNLIIVAAVVVVMGNGGMTKQCFFGSAFYKLRLTSQFPGFVPLVITHQGDASYYSLVIT